MNNKKYFNPLIGTEEDAINIVVPVIMNRISAQSDYFKNINKMVLINSIRVIKRVYKDNATLLDIIELLYNKENKGMQMIKELSNLEVKRVDKLFNEDLSRFFLNDYFTGSTGDRNSTKTYDNSSGLRNIIYNILDNDEVSEFLNPPKDSVTSTDFNSFVGDEKNLLSIAYKVSPKLNSLITELLISQYNIFLNKTKNNI